MRILSYILFFFAFVSIVAACSKGGSPEEDPIHDVNLQDTVFPVVEIFKPVINQAFMNGDTIVVEGKVTDLGLYRGKIKIVNDANGVVIKEQLYEIHGLPLYNFNVKHKTSVNVVSDYTVTVEFEDHGLNITSKTIKVKVNL